MSERIEPALTAADYTIPEDEPMTDEPVKVQLTGTARPEPAGSVEQEARDMLERAGVAGAQSMTDEAVAELAYVLRENRRLRGL